MPGLSLLLPFVEGLVGPKFAKPFIYGALAILAVAAFFGAKAIYDSRVVAKHDAKVEAVNAKADLKASDHAAEQRRADDSRLQTETQEVKDAVQKAGSDPAARRRAYYECVRREQLARASGKLAANC